jgi:hypothetical protein
MSESQIKKGLFAIFYIAFAFTVTSVPVSYAQTALPQGVEPEPILVYTVQPNDKLIVLSSTLLSGLQAWAGVAQYNGLKNPNLIYPGQKLNIPLRYLAAKPSGGTVISASGDVSQGGQPVVLGSPIKEGGKFKTGPNSSAVIELGDGSRIKLLPNTLAEVVSNRDYALRDASSSGSTNWFSGLMRLSEGALEAFASKTTKRATPLKIETPTSVVGVRGTQFRVAFDDPQSKAARTEVLEGLVRAENPAQAAGADLPMGTGAVVKPMDKDIKVVKLLPAPDAAGIAGELVQPEASMALPRLEGAANFRVVIARDAQFDQIVRELKVPVGTAASLSGLATGNWYALVRGIDGIGLEGFNTVKLISIQDAPPSDPWRAEGNKLISMRFEGNRTLINWTASPNDPPLQRYQAMMGADAASLKLMPGSVEARELDLGTLKPGTYFIRLRTTLANGRTVDSALYSFVLSENWGQTVFSALSALQSVK